MTDGARPSWPLAWRGLCALVALLPVGWMLAVPPAPPLVETALSRGAVTALPPPSAARIAEAYPRLAAAPLFWPDRTPWQPPAPAQQAQMVTGALEGYIAVGVMISGDIRQVLIRPPHAGRPQALTEGETLEGWTLRHIDRDRLEFATDTARFEMPIGKRADTRP